MREAGGRTWFTIADGNIEVGREASLASANAAKYLSCTAPGGAATMTASYDGKPREEMSPFKGKLLQQWGRLAFDGKTAQITLNSLWNIGYTPIPPGTHAILTPDYSHANISTGPYLRATPGMVGNDVWFPIGLNSTLANSSRYIHVGHLSEGCVTIHQLERWSAISIISSRTAWPDRAASGSARWWYAHDTPDLLSCGRSGGSVRRIRPACRGTGGTRGGLRRSAGGDGSQAAGPRLGRLHLSAG